MGSGFKPRRQLGFQCSAHPQHSEAEQQAETSVSPSSAEVKPPLFKLILGLAAGGIAETSYLTLVRADRALLARLTLAQRNSHQFTSGGVAGCWADANRELLLQSKLLAAPVACPLSGSCDTVLSSGYAELFGIPLSAFGERMSWVA